LDEVMSYALMILWRDRRRFFPAILAVCFSTTLIVMQCGLLLGIVVYASLAYDNASADLWVTTCDATSGLTAQPIPEAWLLRVAQQPEVSQIDPYLMGPGRWNLPNRGSIETCLIVGARVGAQSLGLIDGISPELRNRLAEPGTVVVDKGNLADFGLRDAEDEFVEINNQRVRVVGTVEGYQGITFLYVFCSEQTARQLLHLERQPGVITLGLAKCTDSRDANTVAQRLNRRYTEMKVYTRDQWSNEVRMQWLIKTRFGVIMCCTVVLALLVGLVVTNQTLAAATLASLREYAMLDALGISRWRLAGLVLEQSFWIGVFGVCLALPAIFTLRWVASLVDAQVILPTWMLVSATLLSLAIAVISGLSALRPLRHLEPALLLR
jgi:putative ABC transport system permease protein